ncbi:RHS repeat-associated core domain-containing protein [Corynebacterium macclintockiae]|uniref:RHS repeat-associated core domain-containing protein n=3 Tax=Corynebacterium macclintockiae TaxID=2913501 RepID=UPI003EBAB43D
MDNDPARVGEGFVWTTDPATGETHGQITLTNGTGDSTQTPVNPAAGWSQARVDATFFALVCDLAGAPQELINTTTGVVEGHTTQTLYGKRTWSGRCTSPLLFAGQYEDAESGWAYNRFRYYNPTLGAYNAQDPLGLAPRLASAQGYVDHAAHWVDALGLMSHVVRNNMKIGNQARDDLAELLPGAITEKYFDAGITGSRGETGKRFVDVFEPDMMIGHEQKTGKVGASRFIRHQVDKDVALFKRGDLREVQWHGDPKFEQLGFTGDSLRDKQFTKPMQDYLTQNNFKWSDVDNAFILGR